MTQEKDEQNIKRRVYDALNVLIALGVLRKEGRKIVGDRDHLLDIAETITRELRRGLAAREAVLWSKR